MAKAFWTIAAGQARGPIREAVRRLGKDRGIALRDAHLAAGLKTNLISLYNSCQDFCPDPRFRDEVLVEEEQWRIWEIYTCPMADMWNNLGEGAIGNLYCEENQHAMVAAYTDGLGKTNLSKVLTCKRDNCCRFSAYFREADMSPEQAKASLPHRDPDYRAPESIPENASFSEGIKALTIKTYYYLLEVAKERFGSEGVCAVSIGLQNWAKFMIPELARHAKCTLNACNADFAAANFPLALDSKEDALWSDYDKNDARELMQIQMLDPIRNSLTVCVAV